MPGKERFLAASVTALEFFLQLTQPVLAEECIPPENIPLGRETEVAGQRITLPPGFRARAVMGEYSLDENQTPCLEDPVLMIKKGYGIAPSMHVRVRDGKITYQNPEGEGEPFTPVEDLLSSLEQQTP